MKIGFGLLTAIAVACSISISPAFSKTAKDCTAEWRADKAGMKARGVTEKAYVEQCKGGAEPNASAPAARPAEAAPPPPTTANGSKTAKECTAEWRADKAGMQARGMTEKAYVEQCKEGEAPAPTSPKPSAAAPPPVAAPSPSTRTSSTPKTAKQCVAEWRADKAGMQARGVTEKSYVEQCKSGGVTPNATNPEPRPTANAPQPSQPAPTATQASPAPAPQRPASTTTAAPAQRPAQQTAAPNETTALEGGQFADEASAKARCPTDTVVWVNLSSKIYHFAGTRSYGTTKRGAYMCEKEAVAAEDRASKTEKHP